MRPTETPPAEGSTHSALSERRAENDLPGRGPAVVTLLALGILLLLVVASVVAGIVTLTR
jgi:hypothetical protein